MKKLILMILFSVSTFASTSVEVEAKVAPARMKNILVSVGDLYDNKDKSWKRQTCIEIHTLANQLVERGVNITCREFDTTNFADPSLQAYSTKNDFHLRIIKDRNKNLGVDVTNWSKKHSSDFNSLGWNFTENENSKVSMKDAYTKAIANFLFYVGNEEAYKAALLVNGAHESNEIEFDEKNQVFRDKFSDKTISINTAYSLFEKESERKKNYLRTGVEIGVLLSSAMAIYYKNLVFNQQDFDYGFKDGMKKKFNGEAVLFDDNDKISNYGHVYAGVMYYQVARSNGFNSLEAFLITQASSAAWELMEYHEVFSINDQILTPIGGYVIGEATHQISCALIQKNSLGATALAYTINPNLAINHGFDGYYKKNKYAAQPDCSKSRWSDISVKIGMEKGQKAYLPSENKTLNVGMDAEVINIEDYNKEGKDGKFVVDTSMTKMMVEMNGNQGLVDLKVIAQVVMAAYHEKNLTRDTKGQLQGYEFVLGLGSASTYNDRGSEEGSANEDFFGTINILGANAHANIHYKGFNLRADFAVYGDFSMVKAYALEPLKASRGGDISNQSSIMKRKGYYWGMGATTLAAISIEKDKWTVGYQGQASFAESINERNRIEATSNDVFRDSILVNRVYVNYAATKKVKLQLAFEHVLRHGEANGGDKRTSTEKRIMGSLIYKF